MTNLLSKFRLTLAAVVFLVVAGATHAQVVIYRLEFKQVEEGINFSFFDHGYLVAPILGGEASLILIDSTIIEGGVYSLAEGAGRTFVAFERDDKRRVVFTAMAANGATEAHYLALGEFTQTVESGDRGFEFRAPVAGELKGRVQAASDESDLDVIPEDGSVGFAGSVEMRGFLLKERTRRANGLNQDVGAVVIELVEFLEKEGLQAEGSTEVVSDAATSALSTPNSNSAGSTAP